MELSNARHFLSEWTTRKQYFSNMPGIKLEKHFKCVAGGAPWGSVGLGDSWILLLLPPRAP